MDAPLASPHKRPHAAYSARTAHAKLAAAIAAITIKNAAPTPGVPKTRGHVTR